jgi:hypothetical protein
MTKRQVFLLEMVETYSISLTAGYSLTISRNFKKIAGDIGSSLKEERLIKLKITKMETENMTTMLEWALDYQKKGWNVIPVNKDKIPFIGWKAYTDKKVTSEEIYAWWTKWPDANIAVITGKISGIVVLDLDSKHGRTSKEFVIPVTACAKSGNLGEHFFFKYPQGLEIKSGAAISGEGVDCRGTSGYIILAPSVNAQGRQYEWTIPFESQEDLAEMPTWFKNLVTDTKSEKKWLLGKDGVSEGSRNDTATSMAGKILSYTAPELWEALGWEQLQIWNQKNNPPLPMMELRAVWDGIKNKQNNSIKVESFIDKCNYLISQIPKDTKKESIISVLGPTMKVLALNAEAQEAEMYIRNKIKSELDIKGKDIESIIKHFKTMRVIILKEAEAEKKIAEQIKEEEPLTEFELQEVDKILKSPTLLYDILKMVKKLGVVGEEKNVLLHYIIFTSRKLKQPLSATVKGDSSSGKSYTLLTTIKLFPKSAYIDLTDATPQSFFYCPDDHFRNKIIVIFEKHGGERADYAIRTLQSEGKLKIQVTEKNPDTGQFEARTIEKEGPTGFVTTTTASLIHAENDTRNISMFPDQSSEQTGRVYESVDSRYLGVQPINENTIKPWRNAQLGLEQMPVYIPFARSFRKYFPTHIVRTRRDYGHFLAIVETVAFLHQRQREVVELHGQKYIRATLADAYMAKIIVEDSLSKSIYELPEKTIEVIEMARVLVEELKADDFGDGDKIKFTISSLAKKLGWDRDTVGKWLKPAIKKGYASIEIESKGSKGAEYVIEEKDLPGDNFLPSVEDLSADNPKERLENIYNPITGEVRSTDAPIHSETVENMNVDTVEVVEHSDNTPLETIGASVETEPAEDIPEFDDFAEFINSNPEKYSEDELPF